MRLWEPGASNRCSLAPAPVSSSHHGPRDASSPGLRTVSDLASRKHHRKADQIPSASPPQGRASPPPSPGVRREEVLVGAGIEPGAGPDGHRRSAGPAGGSSTAGGLPSGATPSRRSSERSSASSAPRPAPTSQEVRPSEARRGPGSRGGAGARAGPFRTAPGAPRGGRGPRSSPARCPCPAALAARPGWRGGYG